MESDVMLYFIIYMIIIGAFLLLVLSPLSLSLSFKLFRITGKNTFLISLVLAIPCMGFLSLPEIFNWNPRIGYPITGLLFLIYCAFLFYKMFKGSWSKSIGLCLSYGVGNVLLILACLFILSLISRDQSLDPGAKEWLSAKPPVVADADNLYYALIGFSVDPHVNPHQAGFECIRNFNEYMQKKAAAQKQDATKHSPPICLSPKTSPVDKELDALCDIAKPDCLARFRTEQAQFDALLQKYLFLINNYKDLWRYSGYSNIAAKGLDTPLLQAGSILKAHKLFSTQTILSYLKGKRPESLSELQRDIAFQHQNLLRSDNFLFLMVSASLLNRDLYLYSFLLDQDVSEKSFQKELEIALLSDKEKDIEKILRGEFQFIESAFQSENIGLDLGNQSRLQRLPRRLIFKPNATVNLFFFQNKNTLEWSRLPADKRLTSPEINTIPTIGFLEVGYNPLGVTLLSIATPSFEPYLYRLDNLDGLIRLVKIKQRIRHDRIPKDQIETFLKQDLPYCKNPYTNQPMTWDAKEETLYFMDPSKEGQKVAVHIPF